MEAWGQQVVGSCGARTECFPGYQPFVGISVEHILYVWNSPRLKPLKGFVSVVEPGGQPQLLSETQKAHLQAPLQLLNFINITGLKCGHLMFGSWTNWG